MIGSPAPDTLDELASNWLTGPCPNSLMGKARILAFGLGCWQIWTDRCDIRFRGDEARPPIFILRARWAALIRSRLNLPKATKAPSTNEKQLALRIGFSESMIDDYKVKIKHTLPDRWAPVGVGLTANFACEGSRVAIALRDSTGDLRAAHTIERDAEHGFLDLTCTIQSAHQIAEELHLQLSSIQWERGFGDSAARKWAAERSNLHCPFIIISAVANQVARTIAREAPQLSRYDPIPPHVLQVCSEDRKWITQDLQQANGPGTNLLQVTRYADTPIFSVLQCRIDAPPAADPASRAALHNLQGHSQRPFASEDWPVAFGSPALPPEPQLAVQGLPLGPASLHRASPQGLAQRPSTRGLSQRPVPRGPSQRLMTRGLSQRPAPTQGLPQRPAQSRANPQSLSPPHPACLQGPPQHVTPQGHSQRSSTRLRSPLHSILSRQSSPQEAGCPQHPPRPVDPGDRSRSGSAGAHS